MEFNKCTNIVILDGDVGIAMAKKACKKNGEN